MHLNNNDIITVGNEKDSNLNILWFHGYGSNNWSFEPIMKSINMRLDEIAYIIMPNAPNVQGKNSWYPLPTKDEKGNLLEDYDGLKTSLDAIDKLVLSLSLNKEKRFIIGGFSQGAALSLSLLFQSKYKIDGCIALSGYMPCAKNFDQDDLDERKIFIAHGFEDKAISYQDYEKTLSFLETKMATITKYTGNFGHSITQDVSDKLVEWIRKT